MLVNYCKEMGKLHAINIHAFLTIVFSLIIISQKILMTLKVKTMYIIFSVEFLLKVALCFQIKDIFS